MDYQETKVYFDGSHYIGIPKTTQGWKKKKHKSAKPTETESKVKEMLNECTDETKQENISGKCKMDCLRCQKVIAK